MTWDQYSAWLGAERQGPPPKVAPPPLAQFSTDTRTIGTGQWFVPISGESFDGHKFIAEAMGRGAAGFFYEASRRAELPPGLAERGMAVNEPLAAFQKLAAGWRLSLKNLRLLALTGSTGKTTTKEMLGSILRAAGPTLATQASFNNEIGVPKTLQNLTPEHRYAALEFGARMPGNIRFLCEMAAPDVVGLINVGVTHVGIFGSVEKLLNTKLEIFRDSPSHAVQIAYHDDPRILDAARKTGKNTLSFGSAEKADIRLLGSDWHAGQGGMSVRLALQGNSVSIPFAIAHEAFPINAAAAAAMALGAGVDERFIAKGLSGFTGVKGRYQIHRIGALTLIDDTYNANPDSMRVGLATVGRAFAGRRLALILGDMLELGDTSTSEHLRVGGALMPLDPSVLITVGPEAGKIAEGAKAAGLPASRIRSFGTVDELLDSGTDLAKLCDVAYAKGSNGIKLGKLVDRLLATNQVVQS